MIPSPSFSRHLVVLRMTRPAGFHFNHGAALNGALCAALRVHPLPVAVIPFACESGRVRFEAGDAYHVGVTLVGADQARREEIERGLARLGSTRPEEGAPMPALAGNFEVEAVHDLPPPDLDAEAAALAAELPTLRLQLVSPLKMERPRPAKEPGAAYFNADYFPVPVLLSRLWGRLFLLEFGRRPTDHERAAMQPAIPEHAHIADPRLLWLDVPAQGSREPDPRLPRGLAPAGVVGTVTLEGVTPDWLPALALGHHLHLGESTHFGFGRYRPGTIGDPFRPARTLLDRVAEPGLLYRALEHVVHHSEAAGEDGITPEEASLDGDRLVATLGQSLRDGTYRPSSLLGVVLPKEGGKVRPLAVPTIRDRVAQRAAAELLTPAVDTLLEDCSFAYRKGLSRAGAAMAIQRAWDEGFRWVLDADIESFFDAVDWPRLLAKLDALFPGEPLVGLIAGWVRAPVVLEGRRIGRSRGLPQGAVISPLLANLFLDELDEDLLGRDYRLVRYADDFVVLCRDADAARRARDDATRALAQLGLELNVEKTAIRTFADGFSYLGYLFCRSLVIDQPRTVADEATPPEDPKVPAASWLAAVPIESVRVLLRPGGRRRTEAVAAPTPLAAEDAPTARPLYVSDPAARLTLRDETLVITTPTGGHDDVAIRGLSHVVFIGQVRATVPVLLGLVKLGVPSFFCRRTGLLYAEVAPHAPDWPLWQAQGEKAADPAAVLEFARATIQAKLHNTRTLAVRLKLQGAGELGRALGDLEKSCLEQTDVEALRGFEGRGAALLFAAMVASLSPEWGFTGRHKHPAPDPVNAMLSFGYTMLYNHISTALHAHGLNPRLGLFHATRGAYHALACDLQEELRHLAEAHVLGLIHRREIRPEDFSPGTPPDEPCLLSVDARRAFIRAFEERLHTPFTPPGDSEAMPYLVFIDRQVQRLKGFILGRAAAYEPLRIHA